VMLTSKTAEPAHARPLAAMAQSSHDHTLHSSPAEAECRPQQSVWSDWWGSWLRQSCWTGTMQTAGGGWWGGRCRERESHKA
jgi:hypothetical protein